MLRLIGATALVYIGYRVGHRILAENGGTGGGLDGLGNAWTPATSDDGAFEDPLVVAGTATVGDLLPKEIDETTRAGTPKDLDPELG